MTQSPPDPAPVAKAPWYSFMTTLQSVAQFGHFFGALSVVLVLSIFFGQTAMRWSIGLGLVYALVKEFWFDIRIEQDSWSDSVMDFMFYAFGGFVAVGLFYLGVHEGRLVP